MSSKGKSKVDGEWFRLRLADKKLSQRQFAKLIDIDPASLHYAIKGTREWKHDELVAFSATVGVSYEETLLHAGLEIPSGGVKGTAPVVGSVDAAGVVSLGPVGAPRRVPLPPEAPESTVAVRYKVAVSAAEAQDGWLLYYVDGLKRVPAEATGRLCVAWLANRGPTMVSILRRGYVRGTFNLQPWTAGAAVMENAQLERASPVLWVRTSA